MAGGGSQLNLCCMAGAPALLTPTSQRAAARGQIHQLQWGHVWQVYRGYVVSWCAQVCSDSYFLFKSPNKASNSLNIFKVWIFILIFMSLSYFIQLSAFTALHCFDSFFTWSLTKKTPKIKGNQYSQSISKSLFFITCFFFPQKITLFCLIALLRKK